MPGIKGIHTRQRDEKACVVGHAHEVFAFPLFLSQEFLAQATISVSSFWFILLWIIRNRELFWRGVYYKVIYMKTWERSFMGQR